MNSLKRTLLLVGLLAVVALLLLWLAHGALTAYTDRERDAGAGDAGAERRDPSRGRVVFADGTPAAAATVTLRVSGEGGGPLVVRSDAEGLFDLPDGMSAGGDAEVSLGPAVAAGRAAPGADLVLPATFDLAGLVKSRAERRGVAGARVTCGSSTVETDGGGGFRLGGLPTTLLRVRGSAVTVAAEGFAPLRWTLQTDLPTPYYGDLLLLLDPAEER